MMTRWLPRSFAEGGEQWNNGILEYWDYLCSIRHKTNAVKSYITLIYYINYKTLLQIHCRPGKQINC